MGSLQKGIISGLPSNPPLFLDETWQVAVPGFAGAAVAFIWTVILRYRRLKGK